MKLLDEEKAKKEETEENLVIDFFTDPVYSSNSLYGIDHGDDVEPAVPSGQNK